jgi:hypothetical protein
MNGAGHKKASLRVFSIRRLAKTQNPEQMNRNEPNRAKPESLVA